MIELKPGDAFCVDNPGWIGTCIKAITKFKAKDDQAEFGHAGTIINSQGGTVESLATIRYGHIDSYKGKRVLILRWRGMTDDGHKLGLSAVTKDIGQIYPFWRLFLHAAGLAKPVSAGFMVCSERVCHYLIEAGCKILGDWRGWNPDDIADLSKWKDFDVVFDGIWEPDYPPIFKPEGKK